MKMRTLWLTIITAFSLLTIQPVSAGSMKCGVHIIDDGGRTGPGKYEVLKKCGEPTYRQGSTWVYEKGSKRNYIVVFNDSGGLSSIRRAD